MMQVYVCHVNMLCSEYNTFLALGVSEPGVRGWDFTTFGLGVLLRSVKWAHVIDDISNKVAFAALSDITPGSLIFACSMLRLPTHLFLLYWSN